MADPRLEQLARVLVHYSTEVKAGDRVGIIAAPVAMPLLREVYREVLRAGGFPCPLLGYDTYLGLSGFDDVFFAEANDDQLQHVSDFERLVRGEFETLIVLRSKENTRSLSAVDNERRARYNRAHAGLREIFRERTARGELRWCMSLYPTAALAQDADMSLEDYEDFVFRGMFAEGEDAVRSWQAIRRDQARLIDWLKGKHRVEVRGPDADLRLSIAGRSFINSCGLFNMPDGEIYTGPVEDSVEGWVRFSYPAVADGVEVEGVELTFEKGRVVKAAARKNEGYLLSGLDTDGGARYVGEWAIGNNARIDRFTRDILFDEKIGGTFHLALGAGYPETGSTNKSAIHWDLICDMRQGGQIVVDGELFYESGAFRV